MMNYEDKGKPVNTIHIEPYKPELDSRGVDFFKHPTARAFSLVTWAHNHSSIELIYVETGTLTVYIDGRWINVKSGEIVLFRSMGVHSIFTDDQDVNEYYVLKIMPSILYNISPKSQKESFPLRFTAFNSRLKTVWKKEEIEGTPIEEGLERLKRQLNADGKSTASDLSLTISLLLVIEGIYESESGMAEELVNSSDTMFRAVVYVESHIADSLAEDEVAKKFGFSTSHFAREFKRTTGKTFKQYIIDARMGKAERLLAVGNHTVSEVAEMCGYSSASHFITMYRKKKGKTPYQKQKR